MYYAGVGRKADGSPQARHGQGSAWRLPAGTWRCAVQVRGKTITGAGRTEREARAEMNRRVRAHQRGEPLPGRAIPATIGAVGPAWLEGLRFTARAPGTLDNYAKLYRKWIGPLPGAPRKPAVDVSRTALAAFGPDQRRAWWAAMARAGASRATVRNADAVMTGLLRAHKARGIHPDVLDPDACPRPTVDRAPRRRPTAAEMARLVGAVDREPYRTLFALKALSGARVGELRGLHWGDVDEVRGGLTIRVQLDRIARQPRDTKGHAQRYVSLGGPASVAMALLRALREVQRERGLPTGAGDPVFLHRFFLSKPPVVVSYAAIDAAFHRARRAAGLPDELTPHALRHGSAMLSLRTGTDLITLQHKLGHADVATTALYLEADTELARSDAARVAEAMRGLEEPDVSPRSLRAGQNPASGAV